jgi:hypothetical protein
LAIIRSRASPLREHWIGRPWITSVAAVVEDGLSNERFGGWRRRRAVSVSLASRMSQGKGDTGDSLSSGQRPQEGQRTATAAGEVDQHAHRQRQRLVRDRRVELDAHRQIVDVDGKLDDPSQEVLVEAHLEPGECLDPSVCRLGA